jgi:aquaporin Z
VPQAWTSHWPEYLIEAFALGAFLVSAAAFTVLIEHPASPVRAAVSDSAVRRALMGAAMGLTAAALIYSPWGRRSGAHMNPAVTLAFLRLGRVAPADAAAYVGAQFAGAIVAMAALSTVAGVWLADPAVSYVTTRPGMTGVAVAFGAELGISFGMMFTVLAMSSGARTRAFTGLAAGLLVAVYITIEAPLSGMSMNPARTFGPAVAAGVADGLWIYFIAPVAGMLIAVEAHRAWRGAHTVACAKLHHNHGPCIFGCRMEASTV